MVTKYLTTDANEVFKIIITKEQADFLSFLDAEGLLREDICIAANNEEIVLYDYNKVREER